MSDVERISTLKDHYNEGEFGTAHQPPGVVLAELRPSAIVQINGAPSEDNLHELFTLDTPPQIRQAWLDGSNEVLWNGPGKWIWVSNVENPSKLVSDLRRTLSSTRATVTDLSHARTVVRVEGERAADVLCKGCPADVEGMLEGDCMATLMGTIATLVHCREACLVFDLYVFRSFGFAFWEWMTDAALEFGYKVPAQTP